MELREASLGEAAQVTELWLSSRAASFPQIPRAVHTDQEVGAWMAQVVLPTREVWVADDGGDIVAVLVLDGEWIDQLYIRPGRTGEGIGSALVAVAKDRRPRGLRLWTFEANIGARRFYERHGFVATATTAGDNEEQAPDVRYDWSPSGEVTAD